MQKITRKILSLALAILIIMSTVIAVPTTTSASEYDFVVSTEASTTKVEIGQDFTYDIKVKPYNSSDVKYFSNISLTLNPEDGFVISNVTSSDSTVNITRNYSTGAYIIRWAPKYDGIVDCESNLATVKMRSKGGEDYYNLTSKTLSVSPTIYHYQGGIYTGYTYTTDFDTVNFYKGCGENLTWSLNTSGVLTIIGTGAMRNYDQSGTPWGNNIKSVIIKNGATSIGDYAFSGCSNLESVAIPESVTSIGSGAFMGCTSLQSISLPSNLTTIGESTFRECTSIKEITIPNGVKELSWCNLMDCTSLEKVTLPVSITKLGLSSIGGCISLTDIYYEGTESEWNNIEKTDGWDSGSPSEFYTLHFAIISVERVTLNKTSATLTVGDTLTLTATITPTNATNKNVTWKSSDTTVATVSNGVVTAKKAGTATITVTTADGSKTATCTVTVKSTFDPNTLTFTVESAKATAGKTISVDIVISNNPGIAGFSFKVGYDSSAMSLVGYECPGWEASSSSFDEDPTKNPVGFSWSRTKDYTANTSILTLTFEIKESAPEGEYSITLTSDDVVSNQAGEDIEYNLVGGKITVIDCTPGDSNGDGVVNSKDAVLLAQLLANWDVEIDLDAADCNGDGAVNSKDAVLLAQYLANWDVTLG